MLLIAVCSFDHAYFTKRLMTNYWNKIVLIVNSYWTPTAIKHTLVCRMSQYEEEAPTASHLFLL